MEDIIKKLNDSNLTGRGGGCFLTSKKWAMVKDASGDKKYVVCNASEGEPGVHKDRYILEHFPEKVIAGMTIAINFLHAEKGYIYLNPEYFKTLEKKLKKEIGSLPINIVKKHHSAGYVGGEETAVINALEKMRIEPRLRPPFPTTNGLHDAPTLINNVETFYYVSLVVSGKYKKKRFYTVTGDCHREGVYELPESASIEKVLRETENYPDYDFFVQVGGGASGEILNSSQLKRPASGSASIAIYSVLKHEPMDLIKTWITFFSDQSCGQCTPCREGTHRVKEIINSPKQDWQMIADIFGSLADTSFCGLGCAAPIAVTTYVHNVLSKLPDNQIKLPQAARQMICECFG